jgi:FixJ family two-component response regulator
MPVSRGAIAVVEDDSGMREALTRLLKAAGFETRGYDSAEAFFDQNATSPVECLVLDVHLPRVSGFELRRRLVDAGRERPVVFITAHDTPSARREADGLHAVAFLTKPFEGRLLLSVVRQALLRRESDSEREKGGT